MMRVRQIALSHKVNSANVPRLCACTLICLTRFRSSPLTHRRAPPHLTHQHLDTAPGPAAATAAGRCPQRRPMDVENCKLACGLVSRGYIEQGAQALAKRHRLVKTLLSQRRLSADGWDDATIEMFIQVSSISMACGVVNKLSRSSGACMPMAGTTLPLRCSYKSRIYPEHAVQGARYP